MARLRASWRTSLPVVQQPRNPQSESIARTPYDIRPIDNSASGDAHGAAVTEKPGGEMTPDERQGKIVRSLAELGEMLKGTVRDLGAIALEAEKLRLEMAELRAVLAEIRRQYS